jgi:hypothetical protein
MRPTAVDPSQARDWDTQPERVRNGSRDPTLLGTKHVVRVGLPRSTVP